MGTLLQYHQQFVSVFIHKTFLTNSLCSLIMTCFPAKKMSISSKLFQVITWRFTAKTILNFSLAFSAIALPCTDWRHTWLVQSCVVLNYREMPEKLSESAKQKIVYNYSDHNKTWNAKGIAKFQLPSVVVENIIVSCSFHSFWASCS